MVFPGFAESPVSMDIIDPIISSSIRDFTINKNVYKSFSLLIALFGVSWSRDKGWQMETVLMADQNKLSQFKSLFHYQIK